MHDNNKVKKENYVIISIATEKAFDANQHPFMIKILRKVKIEWSSLNLSKELPIKSYHTLFYFIMKYWKLSVGNKTRTLAITVAV